MIFNKNLIWMLLLQSVTALAYYGYVPLLPILEEKFELTSSQVGLFTSFTFIGSALISIPSGILVDRIGVRNVLLLATFVMSLVCIAFAISPNVYIILISLFFIGVCYGAVTPATNKHIMINFAQVNRGTVMGFKQMGVPLGSTLGSLFIPYISYLIGWRISLILIGVLLAICGTIYFFSQQKSVSQETVKSTILSEIKIVLRNKNLLYTIGVVIFFIWVQLSTITYLVLYLIEEKNITYIVASASLVLLQVGGVIGRAFWGWLNDKWMNQNRSQALALIALLSSATMFTIVFFQIQSNLLIFYGLIFILGISTQGWNGIFVVLVSEIVEKKYIGLASGISLSIVYLGAIFGTPISGMIIDWQNSYIVMWDICIVFMLFIGLLMLLKPINTLPKTD